MYREALRACPACRTPMQVVRVVLGSAESCVLDVCGACGGGFFDYFAGELGQLARRLIGSSTEPVPSDSGARGRAMHVPACPDCDSALELSSYLEDGPLLYRCEHCLAAFATARQMQLLAQFEHHQKASNAVLRAVGERFGFV